MRGLAVPLGRRQVPRRLPWPVLVALAPASAFLLAFWLLPLAHLLVLGARPDAAGSSGYWQVLTSAGYLSGLAQTVALAAVTTLATLLVAGIAGCFLARHAFVGRSLLVALLTFPLAFPGVVVGFLIILLGGRLGLVAGLTHAFAGTDVVFAYSSVGLVLGFTPSPCPRCS